MVAFPRDRTDGSRLLLLFLLVYVAVFAGGSILRFTGVEINPSTQTTVIGVAIVLIGVVLLLEVAYFFYRDRN